MSGSEPDTGGGSDCQAVKLTWSQFSNNLRQSTMVLRGTLSFTDIFLAAEHKQISAHRFVLATGSAFFHKLLESGTAANSCVYLYGVKYDDLASILDFLYTGQVVIEQERLQQFLSVAEELGIKGLVEESTQENQLDLENDHMNKDESRNKEEVMILSNVNNSPQKRAQTSPIKVAEGASHDHNYMMDSNAEAEASDHNISGEEINIDLDMMEEDQEQDVTNTIATNQHMVQIPMEYVGGIGGIKRSISVCENESRIETNTSSNCQVILKKISSEVINTLSSGKKDPKPKVKRGRKRKAQSEPSAALEMSSDQTGEGHVISGHAGNTLEHQSPETEATQDISSSPHLFLTLEGSDKHPTSDGSRPAKKKRGRPSKKAVGDLGPTSETPVIGPTSMSQRDSTTPKNRNKNSDPAKNNSEKKKRGRPAKSLVGDLESVFDVPQGSGRIRDENQPAATPTVTHPSNQENESVEVVVESQTFYTQVKSPAKQNTTEKQRNTDAPPGELTDRTGALENTERGENSSKKKGGKPGGGPGKGARSSTTSDTSQPQGANSKGGDKAFNKENQIESTKHLDSEEDWSEENEAEYKDLKNNTRIANIVDVMLVYKNRWQNYSCSICQHTFQDNKVGWLHVAKDHVVGNLKD